MYIVHVKLGVVRQEDPWAQLPACTYVRSAREDGKFPGTGLHMFAGGDTRVECSGQLAKRWERVLCPRHLVAYSLCDEHGRAHSNGRPVRTCALLACFGVLQQTADVCTI